MGTEKFTVGNEATQQSLLPSIHVTVFVGCHTANFFHKVATVIWRGQINT